MNLTTETSSAWDHDELTILVDVYNHSSSRRRCDREIAELAPLLQQYRSAKGIAAAKQGRSYSCLQQMMSQIRYLETHGRKGDPCSTAQLETAWSEYHKAGTCAKQNAAECQQRIRTVVEIYHEKRRQDIIQLQQELLAQIDAWERRNKKETNQSIKS